MGLRGCLPTAKCRARVCGILKKHFGSWFVSPAHRGKSLQLFRDCSHTINTELVFSLLFHEYTKNHRVQTTQQPTTLSARIGFSLQRLHGGDSTHHEQNVVNCLLFFFLVFCSTEIYGIHRISPIIIPKAHARSHESSVHGR